MLRLQKAWPARCSAPWLVGEGCRYKRLKWRSQQTHHQTVADRQSRISRVLCEQRLSIRFSVDSSSVQS